MQKKHFKSSTFADNTTIDNICQHFKRANNIFIFGYGASYVCATDLYQKLSRIGLNVQLVQETHLFTTMLSTHDKEDCVVFITNNGDQSELRAMVKVVSDYNIPIITISSSEHNHVAQHSDIVLTYGHSDEMNYVWVRQLLYLLKCLPLMFFSIVISH